jgi:hypothetical protein
MKNFAFPSIGSAPERLCAPRWDTFMISQLANAINM